MNQADTAWMLISTALVLLMTPALAFFYGGLARSKNALNTMMMSFISLGFVGVAWALIGYTLAFSGTNRGSAICRTCSSTVSVSRPRARFPHMLFMAFQGTFCIITAALISGRIIERMRFSAYVAFITIWAIAIYAPIAHWVWGGGWLATLGAFDFAGGTVVHVNAAAAALVAALVLGKRSDYGSSSILPHNVPFVCSALASCGLAGSDSTPAARWRQAAGGLAFVTTMLAPAATLVVWTILDAVRTASRPVSAVRHGDRRRSGGDDAGGRLHQPAECARLGAIAAVPSYFGILVRSKTSLDDSLDVVAAHGLGWHGGRAAHRVSSREGAQWRVRWRACSGIRGRSWCRARPFSARCSTARRARSSSSSSLVW
jgi:Amt family ammonium transporter